MVGGVSPSCYLNGTMGAKGVPVTFFADWVRTRMPPACGDEPPRDLEERVAYAGIDRRLAQARGAIYLHLLRRFANLRPSDVVLDVGCGYGRMARYVAPYLTHGGHYVGIDIDAGSIQRGHELFRRTAPHQQRQCPVSLLPLAGPRAPFPLANESVDLVVTVASVTMRGGMNAASHATLLDGSSIHRAGRQQLQIEATLAEMARVMRNGARALLMFYLVDEIAREQLCKRDVDLFFLRYKRFRRGPSAAGWLSERDDTMYSEAYVRKTLAPSVGLRVVKVVKGGWPNRVDRVDDAEGVDWDVDHVLLEKRDHVLLEKRDAHGDAVVTGPRAHPLG